jgi:hypothetical protein
MNGIVSSIIEHKRENQVKGVFVQVGPSWKYFIAGLENAEMLQLV